MLILLPVVLGVVALLRMSTDLFPNVEMPVITVVTNNYGTSAEQMELGVTKPIEEVVNTISGIDELTSVSREGSSRVIIRFILEKDRDIAQQEVQAKVNTILNNFPEGTNSPIIEKFDVDATPVLTIAVSGDTNRSLRELTELADKRIRQSISSLRGVGSVTIVGGEKRAIQIEVNSEMLQKYKVGINEVRRVLAAETLERPGGRVMQGSRELSLRITSVLRTADDFNNIIVKEVNGQPVRLRDIGIARDSIEEPRGLVELDGVRGVTLVVLKQSGSNTIEAIETVKAKLADMEKSLPAEGFGDVRLQIIRDQSRFIEASIHEVKWHLMMGAVLVSLTILLFLRDWRTMVIASISIPISLVATCFVMRLCGFTFNNITMLAMVMAVGIVIDDAVVVHENIFRWMEEKGLKAREAALGATNEVALAVMATTFSLVVIFLPIAFMEGQVGRFFQSFGVTMAISILVSLFVSFTLTPMLCSRYLKLSKKTEEAIKRGDHSHHSGGVYGWVAEKPYMWLLRFSMRHRLGVVVTAVIVMASLFPLPLGSFIAGTRDSTPEERAANPSLPARVKDTSLDWLNYPGLASLLGFDFIPQDDQNELEVAITTPPGYTLEATRIKAAEMAEELRKNFSDVTLTLVTIGDTSGKATRATGDVTRASVYMQLKDLDKRSVVNGKKTSAFDLIDRARVIIAANGSYKDFRNSVQVPANLQGGGINADIELVVSGPDLATLQRNTDNLLARIRGIKGMADVNVTIPANTPEYQIPIDSVRANALGLDKDMVASALQTVIGGEVIGNFNDKSNGQQYDVWLRGDLVSRSNRKLIAETPIATAKGMIPLSAVAKPYDAQGPSQIDHFMQQRKITIVANTAKREKQNQFLFFKWKTEDKMPVGDAVTEINKVIEGLRNEKLEIQMTPAYTTTYLGRAKVLAQTLNSFLMAFGLSLVFMYMILAAQFESFLHPVTILLAVPLTIPFAVLSLLLMGQNANLYAILGVFLLFGIVKKNGILQVDYSNHLREKGMPRDAAVLEANKTRLRPILMTTVMLVAGMVPIALGQGPGSAARASMAKVIIGGQVLSLLLTLVVTPVCYTLFDDFGRFFRGERKSPPPSGKPAAHPHVESVEHAPKSAPEVVAVQARTT
jgi:HAE1 family hydrophobic/amphiphilic exporter-1